MQSINQKLLRVGLWWQHLVPPVFLFAYLGIFLEGMPLGEGLMKLGLLAISIVGTAAFGYFLNDWTDIEQDQAAGKPNSVSGLSLPIRLLLLFGLPLIAAIPWIWLPYNVWNLSLLGLQFVVFILYSVRPIRFKERSVLGLLADMSYGHVIPALITLTTFLHFETVPWEHFPAVYVFVLPWVALKGIRNILQHQIDDRKKDKKAGVKTFVLAYGPEPSLRLVNLTIRPMEQFALATFLIVILVTGGIHLLWFYLFFLIWTALKFSFWWLPTLPFRQIRFKFIYYLNDFYEDWMPTFLLALLAIQQPEFWILFGINLLLFPKIILNFIKDFKVIRKNLKEGKESERF